MPPRKRKARRQHNEKKFPEVMRMFKAIDGADKFQAFLAGVLSATTVANKFPLPRKSTRLEQLYDHGFNCADFRYWLRGQLSLSELEKFFYRHGKISLRNFTEEKYSEPTPRLPVMYGVGRLGAIKHFCAENNKVYHTLVNQFLEIDDSLYAGNLILLGGGQYAVSLLEGSATPRDVDVPRTDVLVFQGGFDDEVPDMPAFIPEMANQFRNFLPELRPITIEFSYYPYKVGRLNQQLVFWEWRGGSTHDLFTIIFNLSLKAKRLQTAIEL